MPYTGSEFHLSIDTNIRSREQHTVCSNKIIDTLIGPITFKVVIEQIIVVENHDRPMTILSNTNNVCVMCGLKLTFL